MRGVRARRSALARRVSFERQEHLAVASPGMQVAVEVAASLGRPEMRRRWERELHR